MSGDKLTEPWTSDWSKDSLCEFSWVDHPEFWILQNQTTSGRPEISLTWQKLRASAENNGINTPDLRYGKFDIIPKKTGGCNCCLLGVQLCIKDFITMASKSSWKVLHATVCVISYLLVSMKTSNGEFKLVTSLLGLLVVSQWIDAFSKDQKWCIDVSCFFQTLSCILSLGASLWTSQIT